MGNPVRTPLRQQAWEMEMCQRHRFFFTSFLIAIYLILLSKIEHMHYICLNIRAVTTTEHETHGAGAGGKY
jgi:hypothetical protein